MYMAPKQIAGEPTTPHGDVYATGVLLFTALIGGLPWPAHDVLPLLAENTRSPSPALDPSRPRWLKLPASTPV